MINKYWKLINTYKNYSFDYLSQKINFSFQNWSQYINVDFIQITRELSTEDKVDPNIIVIGFFSKEHMYFSTIEMKEKEDQAFDGPGGTLAHSSFPKLDSKFKFGLLMHFDADEDFIFEPSIWNLLSKNPVFTNVCIHEIGHILGFDHKENDKRSIMYPYDNRFITTLSADDVKMAQAIYGVRNNSPKPPDDDSDFTLFIKYNYRLLILIVIFIIIYYYIFKAAKKLRNNK